MQGKEQLMQGQKPVNPVRRFINDMHNLTASIRPWDSQNVVSSSSNSASSSENSILKSF